MEEARYAGRLMFFLISGDTLIMVVWVSTEELSKVLDEMLGVKAII